MEYFFNFNKLPYLKGRKPEGCILCGIVAKKEGAIDLRVHESASFVVSLNLYPYNPGHCMIFPKRHLVDIRDYSRMESIELHEVLTETLDVLSALYSPQAYTIGYNMGLEAGASIEHLHLHLIPRYGREIGIAELIGGGRVLVEDPKASYERLKEAFALRETRRA
jgi:ATP adenylyltransferase